VVTRGASGLPERDRVDSIDIVRAPGGRVAFARAIASQIAGKRPDAVLAQYSALPAAVLAARKARVPCIGIVHDVYGVADSIRLKGTLRGLARTLGLEQWLRLFGPDAFLVPSRAVASRLTGLGRGRPITVVPAGGDHLPPGEPVARDPRQLIFVGRLVPQKGVADIIAAVRILTSRGWPCHVVIVGEGPAAAALQSRARALGEAVRFAGSVPDGELDREIRRSLALLLPSRREGWGLAVTEAASRGTPYVAYDIPAVREQHGQLQGGLLVAAGPEPLAAGIEELLADPAHAELLGERGREAAATMTWADAAAVVERSIVAVGTLSPR
jgi:glycosyltransferase involved in cell wall biosynthesis